MTPWTVVRQAPLSMEFSRQEFRSGSHSFLQGNLPNQGSNWSFQVGEYKSDHVPPHLKAKLQTTQIGNPGHFCPGLCLPHLPYPKSYFLLLPLSVPSAEALHRLLAHAHTIIEPLLDARRSFTSRRELSEPDK